MCASTWLHYVYPLKKISSWISIGSEPAKFGARDCITIYMPVNQKKAASHVSESFDILPIGVWHLARL